MARLAGAVGNWLLAWQEQRDALCSMMLLQQEDLRLADAIYELRTSSEVSGNALRSKHSETCRRSLEASVMERKNRQCSSTPCSTLTIPF